MNEKKPPLFMLVGPTGVGKTECSIQLAKKLDAEIISCDSMQIYKRMDIGTAKVSKEEMQGVVHHLIDIREPFESYSVCDYTEDAKRAFKDILSRGKNALVVGGTGLYADSFAKGTEFCENGNSEEIRKELQDFYEKEGADKLHLMLSSIDPESASAIHKNNVKRVIRAIEYYRLTGEKISEHNKKDSQKPSPYRVCTVGLTRNRDELYERIDKRVDIMISQGLIGEVMSLYKEGIDSCHNSMQALGYKEILHYIKGRATYDEAIRILKRDSRRYAKRQLTWFGRNKEISWINLTGKTGDVSDMCMEYMKKLLDK